MKYSELTLDQRISLKGEFEINPELGCYKAVMILWGFIEAVEFFLNDDLSVLRKKIFYSDENMEVVF